VSRRPVAARTRGGVQSVRRDGQSVSAVVSDHDLARGAAPRSGSAHTSARCSTDSRLSPCCRPHNATTTPPRATRAAFSSPNATTCSASAISAINHDASPGRAGGYPA
jgi:hypothetical protein